MHNYRLDQLTVMPPLRRADPASVGQRLAVVALAASARLTESAVRLLEARATGRPVPPRPGVPRWPAVTPAVAEVRFPQRPCWSPAWPTNIARSRPACGRTSPGR